MSKKTSQAVLEIFGIVIKTETGPDDEPDSDESTDQYTPQGLDDSDEKKHQGAIINALI